MQYHSFTRILVRVVSLFHPFKAGSSLSKENGISSPLPTSRIFFSAELIDFLIVHTFGSFLPSEIQSQAVVFSPFGMWQCGSGP